MNKKYMDRFVGKYCKIVTKEPGEKRASVVTGILEDIDYEDGFILIDSEQGLGALSISTIIAIKPANKHKGEHKRSIKNEQHAVIGIGTLIVFIAMVLVAAVAASVIIQTSENLQNRAYAVGKQTIREVSSGVTIVDQMGYTNEEKTIVQYLAISIRPRAGSYDLDLNETLIYLQYDNLTVLSLNYWNGTDSVTSSVSDNGVFHTLNHECITATSFGVIGIRDSDDSVENTFGLGTGDMCMIIINLTAAFPNTEGLQPGEELYGRLVPETGAAGVFLCNAPNAFDNRVVEL